MQIGVDRSPSLSLALDNEYIVYDLAQIKLKYLVRVKFNYDGGARW